MGNACCSCCSKRERSVEDLVDGSLEDKLLGKAENDEVTIAEEEVWRQRREQLKDEADMSMQSLNDEDDNAHAPLVWDLSDRNTVRDARKEAIELVEDEEDEENFEDSNDEEDDDESKEYVAQDGDIDRLTQLSAKSADSYASVNDFFRGDTRVFRDTELDRATETSDTFLTSTSPSSIRGIVANDSFLVDDEQNQEQEQQQKEEHEDHDQHDEKRRGSGSSRRKKKSRSKKSRK